MRTRAQDLTIRTYTKTIYRPISTEYSVRRMGCLQQGQLPCRRPRRPLRAAKRGAGVRRPWCSSSSGGGRRWRVLGGARFMSGGLDRHEGVFYFGASRRGHDGTSARKGWRRVVGCGVVDLDREMIRWLRRSSGPEDGEWRLGAWLSPPNKVHFACVRQPLDIIMRAALFGTQAALPQTVTLRPGCLRHGKSKTAPIAFFSRLSRPPRPRQPYASHVPHRPPHGLLTYPAPQVFPRCLRFALPVITWSCYLAVVGTPPCVTLNS